MVKEMQLLLLSWLLLAAINCILPVFAQHAVFQNHHIEGGRQQGGIRTLLICRAKCQINPRCAAIDFDLTGKTCWFHGPLRSCLQPTPLANTIHERYTNCHENSHGLGGNRQSEIRDEATCVSSCQGNCLAADFDQSDNTCWFHTEGTACKPLRTKAGCRHYSREGLCATGPLGGSTPAPSRETGVTDVAFEAAPPNVLAKIANRIANRHVVGGNLVSGFRDWISCVRGCLGQCRAVDFDRRDRSCWHHFGQQSCNAPVTFRASCTHYTMNTCKSGPILNDMGTLPIPPPPRMNTAVSASIGQCGVPDVSPNGGRIVGGDEARPHSWPWQVALRNRNARSSRCAGTFVAPQWILTTAHCVDQDLVPGNWLLLSGAHDLLAVENNRIAHTVQRIVLHERFDLNTFDNDIALMKISAPVSWSRARSPICLPPPGFQFVGGTNCIIIGWGVAAGGRRPLKQATIPVVPDNTCRRPDWLGSEFTLTPRMMCAGYEHGGVDTCQGDSGGPLVCFINNRWVQAGLTSFGRGCGLPQKPGVYTKVSMFNDWIQGVINSF